MKIAYIKASIIEHNEEKQIEALEKYNIEKWFKDEQLAKNIDRPELQNMLEFAREGDTIYVLDFSRLAKSTVDLLSLIERLNEKRVNLISVKEGVDTSTPTGKLMLTMVGAIAEFEKVNILERQREGIEIAKKEGKYVGRQPTKVNKEKFEEAYSEYMSRKLTKVQFADKVGITRPTLDKFIRAYETNSLSETEGSYFCESK